MEGCVILVDGHKMQSFFTSENLELKIKPNLDMLFENSVDIVREDKAVMCNFLKASKLKLFDEKVSTVIVREDKNE
jgi:hypothetical protein